MKSESQPYQSWRSVTLKNIQPYQYVLGQVVCGVGCQASCNTKTGTHTTTATPEGCSTSSQSMHEPTQKPRISKPYLSRVRLTRLLCEPHLKGLYSFVFHTTTVVYLWIRQKLCSSPWECALRVVLDLSPPCRAPSPSPRCPHSKSLPCQRTTTSMACKKDDDQQGLRRRGGCVTYFSGGTPGTHAHGRYHDD